MEVKSDDIRSFFDKEELDESDFVHYAALKVIQTEKAQKAFDLIDVDDKGVVVLEDLQRLSSELEEDFTEQELEEMIEFADRSGDGMLRLKDFIKIARKLLVEAVSTTAAFTTKERGSTFNVSCLFLDGSGSFYIQLQIMEMNGSTNDSLGPNHLIVLKYVFRINTIEVPSNGLIPLIRLGRMKRAELNRRRRRFCTDHLTTMYSDLFDALGGGPGGNTASTSTSTREEPKPLLSFKAGKVGLALQENGKYWATPDTRRGQVNLKYNDSDQLTWEWYDRREKKVMDTIIVTEPVSLARADVPKSQDADTNDRVYYWKLDNQWRMIWLQDKEEDKELIGKVNDILKKPKKPAETSESTTAGSGDSPVSASSPGNASTSSASTTTRQVDALSNILENLGMPQGEGRNAATSSSAAASTTPAAAASGGRTLTLADLQGVMAGLQTQQGSQPGLHDIVSSEAIKDLLSNEDVRNRLMQELPEEQRTPEHLEENLRSPQVQQTLRSLTAALMPDDNGSMDGYHSVLANFQLDAADGQQALTESNNPIQAFLDCVLASVKKEKGEESKDEEMKD
eukprot:scaffold22635_cov134-Cylindrotheca_fusiformis.AAC.3